MKFRVSCELDYTLNHAATFLFALKCIQTGGQKILSESLKTDPPVDIEEFTIETGMNRFSRIRTFNPGSLRLNYEAEVEVATRVVSADAPRPDGPSSFGPQAIPFLFPSRYCPSDMLRKEAADLFGHLGSPYEIATAVCDWIYNNVRYVSGSSGETSSAVDTFQQKQGVCRDFSHLAITFCRALNLPARYATCYAYKLEPPDFHACFEVFIDGWWYVFDATRLAPLNGLVQIATGRDAADAAVCTIFGDPTLTKSAVKCECLEENFQPLTSDALAGRKELIALL